MVAKLKNEHLRMALAVQIALGLILLLWLLTTAAHGQTPLGAAQSAAVPAGKTETAATPAAMPLLKNYREITIGMESGAVREKLGKARVQDKDGFYYEFSAREAAQIALDGDGKVRAISIIYRAKDGDPPKFEEVFGPGERAEPRENGALYHLVRYPAAGYWVAYNRTAGDNAIVTVTFQKL
jgi:hypothetical protein